MTTYEVVNLANLEARIEKINRRASKLGCAPVTVEVLGSKRVPVKNPADIIVGWNTVYTVAVRGETPKLAGWTFAATLEHLGVGVNIVRTVPGVELDLTAYRTAPPVCEHCKTARRRTDTYLLAHEDGRIVQVGKTCIADFLGGMSPAHAIALADMLLSAGEACEGEGGFGGGGAFDADLGAYLAFVACSIRLDGWLSRTAARDTMRSSTADIALNCGSFAPPTMLEESKLHPEAQDIELARAALEHARANLVGKSDYEHNLRVVIDQETIEGRHAGIAASVIPWYQRELGRAIERKKAAQSEYVGAVGKRSDFALTLAAVHSFEGQFGVSHLHRFLDGSGNVVVWKTGTELLEIGEEYAVKGTVKAHEEYRGIRQTVLSRCKVA